jgi:hypothetical protein
MPDQLSLSPAQTSAIEQRGGIAIKAFETGNAMVLLPDLSEWTVDGEGIFTVLEPAPSMGLGDGWDAGEDFGPTDLPAIIKELRRPMTPAAVRWKVQNALGGKANPKGALIVPYIDARLVEDRLNTVCPGAWEEGDVNHPDRLPFEVVNWGKGALLCRLSVARVCRQDVGYHGKGEAKAMVSDSLKRAAVKFGIGSFLYAMPKIKFSVESGLVRIWKPDDGPPKIFLTDPGEAYLPLLYAQWLQAHGVDAFGVPLDHGDSASALGDVEGGQELSEGDAEDAEPTEEVAERRKGRGALKQTVAGDASP